MKKISKDYFDSFLNESTNFERDVVDSFDEPNSYRYSLVVKRNIFDFVLRDGDVYIGKKIVDIGTHVKGDIYKVVGYESNHFTYFTMRTNNYFDKNNLCEHFNANILIIQNQDKANNILNPRIIPSFGLDSRVWLNPNLSEIGFNQSNFDPKIIANILNE